MTLSGKLIQKETRKHIITSFIIGSVHMNWFCTLRPSYLYTLCYLHPHYLYYTYIHCGMKPVLPLTTDS